MKFRFDYNLGSSLYGELDLDTEMTVVFPFLVWKHDLAFFIYDNCSEVFGPYL